MGIVECRKTERLPQTKSAEYEKPRNSSCMACDRTVDFVSSSLPITFEGHSPDCTGVKTGVTLVNSESKLLVSVALVI